jgi:mitochondrial GTPase 1
VHWHDPGTKVVLTVNIGVFIPYVPNVETMLKLALVGCVKDTVIPLTTLADYLLYRLNLYDPNIYSKYSPPTNDILELLTCMAKATGRLAKGGVPELEGTAMWLLGRYRAGEMGTFILDDVSKDAYENWKKAESEAEPSASALRREAKRERLRISKAKYESKNSASVE